MGTERKKMNVWSVMIKLVWKGCGIGLLASDVPQAPEKPTYDKVLFVIHPFAIPRGKTGIWEVVSGQISHTL